MTQGWPVMGSATSRSSAGWGTGEGRSHTTATPNPGEGKQRCRSQEHPLRQDMRMLSESTRRKLEAISDVSKPEIEG